jgi:nucleotide-binding universal stress UspA family protein
VGPCCQAVVVSHDGDVKEERETYYSEVQADAKRIAAEHGPALATRIEGGQPAQTIVRVAQEDGYDLVVMGPTGHSSPWGLFMGTTADKVTRHVTCSVLVIR